MDEQRTYDDQYAPDQDPADEPVDDSDPSTLADVPQAPLPTGQTIEVHPASLASAKDALAAHHAAERAVEEHGEDAAINPDD